MRFTLQREHRQELQAVQEQVEPQELQTAQAQDEHCAGIPKVGIRPSIRLKSDFFGTRDNAFGTKLTSFQAG